MKFIMNNTGIVFFHQNKPIKIDKSSNQYLRIIKAFDLPESEQEAAIFEILDQSAGSFERDGFKITPEEVIYKGEELPEALANKVRSIAEEGLPVSLFGNFWDNLQLNPSANSVRELYDFLSYKELPITEDGCFLAYKGLNSTGWSISGNKKTKVLKGKVNASGHIHNAVGEEIEVRRWDVDDDRQNHCSYGLHVGSLSYAEDFSQGMVVVVKINPKDVVSVPQDYSCQKCRVSAYKVIDIFSEEIKAPVCDEDGEQIFSQEKEESEYFDFDINSFLKSMYEEGRDTVLIRDIQDSFYPDRPSKQRVINALANIGYTWEEGDEEGVVYL